VRGRPPWRDLINQRWCLTPDGFAGRISREHLNIHLARKGLKLPAHVIEANSLLMQIALFETDDFLSIAPMLVAKQLEQRRLACILDLPPIGPVDPVFLMWSGNIPLSSAARRFRDHIIARLDEKPVTLSFDAPRAARGKWRRS
jgi:DNA-binding transcriptional LysR family regulator